MLSVSVFSEVSIVSANSSISVTVTPTNVEATRVSNSSGYCSLKYVPKDIDPDIIAIGPDQTHNVEKLQKEVDKRGLKAKVQRVKVYHKDELDSSCKIIKKIKNTDFEGKILDNCENWEE